MIDIFSECIIKVFMNDSATLTTITLEAIFCIIVIIFGVLINHTFMKRLEREKKYKPLGRKGNVVEPIMTGCCWVQITYWPIRLALAWIFHNEIIKPEMMPIWMRYTVLNVLMVGRIYLCYYSFFCALIRYIYIVHYEKVYYRDFEWVAKWMKTASYLIPTFVGTLSINVVGGFQFKGNDIFDTCSNSILDEGKGNAGISLFASIFPNILTTSVIRIIYYFTVLVWIILGVNIVEACMYRTIFATIGRSSEESLVMGTITSQTYLMDKQRSLVSLRVCFLGWAWEALGTIMFLIVPLQRYLGLTYLHCFDALLTFILIPIVYLANDEETKEIIVQKGWYEGIKHMIHYKNKVQPS